MAGLCLYSHKQTMLPAWSVQDNHRRRTYFAFKWSQNFFHLAGLSKISSSNYLFYDGRNKSWRGQGMHLSAAKGRTEIRSNHAGKRSYAKLTLKVVISWWEGKLITVHRNVTLHRWKEINAHSSMIVTRLLGTFHFSFLSRHLYGCASCFPYGWVGPYDWFFPLSFHWLGSDM